MCTHNLAKVSSRTHCRFENSCGIYYAPTHFSNSFHSRFTAVYVSQELMGKILGISKIGHLYRAQAYFRKSNVFTSVCQEFCRGVGVSQYALGGVGCVSQHALGWGCVSQHSMRKGVWQTPPRQTPSRQTPPPGRPLQRTVSILLECILVISCDLAVAVATLLILNLEFQNWFVVTNSWQTP